MRFKKPKPGDTRIISKFPIFPITLNYETVWLEKCYIKQRYKQFCTPDLDPFYAWDNEKFVSVTDYNDFIKQQSEVER